MRSNHFFAMLSRLKYINRWGLMRNTNQQNNSEHSLEVAYIAHALGVINNTIFQGSLNPERLAILGIYHDATEIITGDMPTPIKYSNPVIRDAYKQVEKVAGGQLLTGLPEELKPVYESILMGTGDESENWKYVKAADKISAYIKCIEETQMGNLDFSQAKITVQRSIYEMHLPEVDYFMEHFIPAYNMTLDESNEKLGEE